MSAIRMLSAKLLEPTTTVPAPALPSASGSLPEEPPDEHPARSAAEAASATAAAPKWLLLDLVLFVLEVTIPVPG